MENRQLCEDTDLGIIISELFRMFLPFGAAIKFQFNIMKGALISSPFSDTHFH